MWTIPPLTPSPRSGREDSRAAGDRRCGSNSGKRSSNRNSGNLTSSLVKQVAVDPGVVHRQPRMPQAPNHNAFASLSSSSWTIPPPRPTRSTGSSSSSSNNSIEAAAAAARGGFFSPGIVREEQRPTTIRKRGENGLPYRVARRTSAASNGGKTEVARSAASTAASTRRPFVGRSGGDGGGGGGGVGDGGGGGLADQVYDLSAMLGRLRTRSDRVQELLRAAAQGFPELEQAFRPLLSALEAGIARCNQADLEAVFGRPTLALLAAKQSLPVASPHPRRSTSSAGAVGGDGGRPTAVEILADAVSALKQDVEAAEWLTHEGGRLRTIARWSRRCARSTMIFADPTMPATPTVARPAANHYIDGGIEVRESPGMRISRKVGMENHERQERSVGNTAARFLPCDDGRGAMRIFRARANESTSVAGRENRGTRTDNNRGQAKKRSEIERTGEGKELAAPRPLVVVVQTLRALLPPPVTPPPAPCYDPAANEEEIPRAAAPASSFAGRWRRPLAWLMGSSSSSNTTNNGQAAATATAATETSAQDVLRSAACSAEDAPPAPMVILRVVCSGCTSDLAALVTNAGATACPAGGGDSSTVDPRYPATVSGDDKFSTFEPAAGAGGKAGVGSAAAAVELVKSEVRMVEVVAPTATATATGDAKHGDDLHESGSENSGVSRLSSSPAKQLQVVFQLRTNTPVRVARLEYRGGNLVDMSNGGRTQQCQPMSASTPDPRYPVTAPATAAGVHHSSFNDRQQPTAGHEARYTAAGDGGGGGVSGGFALEKPWIPSSKRGPQRNRQSDSCDSDRYVSVAVNRHMTTGPTNRNPDNSTGLDEEGGEDWWDVVGGDGDGMSLQWGEIPQELSAAPAAVPGATGRTGNAQDVGVDHFVGLNVLLPSAVLPMLSIPTSTPEPAVTRMPNPTPTRRFTGTVGGPGVGSARKRRRPNMDDDDGRSDDGYDHHLRSDRRRECMKPLEHGSSGGGGSRRDNVVRVSSQNEMDSDGYGAGHGAYNREREEQQYRRRPQQQRHQHQEQQERLQQRQQSPLQSRECEIDRNTDNPSENDDPRQLKRRRKDGDTAAAAALGTRSWTFGFPWFWRRAQEAEVQQGRSDSVAESSPGPIADLVHAEQSSAGRDGGVNDSGSAVAGEASESDLGHGDGGCDRYSEWPGQADRVNEETRGASVAPEKKQQLKTTKMKLRRSPVIVTVVLAPPPSGDGDLA